MVCFMSKIAIFGIGGCRYFAFLQSLTVFLASSIGVLVSYLRVQEYVCTIRLGKSSGGDDKWPVDFQILCDFHWPRRLSPVSNGAPSVFKGEVT